MTNKLYVGKYMYTIFSNQNGEYVQPYKVTEITKNGFWAECHNGGENGHGCGKEFFEKELIGNGVYFSKDSAEINLRK